MPGNSNLKAMAVLLASILASLALTVRAGDKKVDVSKIPAK